MVKPRANITGSSEESRKITSVEERVTAIEEEDPNNIITTRGDLIVGDPAGSPVRLPRGTTNQFLKTNASGDLEWDATAGGSSPLTTKGDLYTYDTGDQRLGIGADGSVLEADSGQATGLIWNTTLKGDVSTNQTDIGNLQSFETDIDKLSSSGQILSHNGSTYVAVSSSSDNDVPRRSGGAVVFDSSINDRLTLVESLDVGTTAGDLIRYSGSAYERLGRGTANQVLKTNAGGTDIEWADPSSNATDVGNSVGDLITVASVGPVTYTDINLGSSGQYLRSNGVLPGYSPILGTDLGMTAAGDILVASDTPSEPTLSRLALGAEGYVLRSEGSGAGGVKMEWGPSVVSARFTTASLATADFLSTLTKNNVSWGATDYNDDTNVFDINGGDSSIIDIKKAGTYRVHGCLTLDSDEDETGAGWSWKGQLQLDEVSGGTVVIKQDDSVWMWYSQTLTDGNYDRTTVRCIVQFKASANDQLRLVLDGIRSDGTPAVGSIVGGDSAFEIMKLK